jgi:hypothetical protein
MMTLYERQVAHNAESRTAWVPFGPHRAAVTQLLLGGLAPGPARLCVLGAGNCNDLDLAALVGDGREVHLVDLDADALAAGVQRQQLAEHPAIHRHGGVDLTAVLDRLARWSPQASVADDDLAACVEAPARDVRPALPGPFDRVASTCLLSQLVSCAFSTLGPAHPRFVAALQAIRAGHLRLILDLVTPGGIGLLISDFVSSESFPPLATITTAALGSVLPRLVLAQNFFHGVNPGALTAVLRNDPAIAPQIDALECVPPWLWNLGPRVYAVAAWKFRKRAEPV